MDALVCPREKSLGGLLLVLGVLGWLLLLVGTVGIALIYILFGFVFYVFAQSALIAYLRGTAVRLSAEQFPDLHARFLACCTKLGMADVPEAYVLQGSGLLNAFATRFLGRNFVVLLSDVVDALAPHPDGVDFYIGHELGHIRCKHLTGHLWRWPALWLPLAGAAYARAKESTCDRHGLACSSSPENAARALMLLSAGHQRWATANLDAYARQAHESAGFWASFHELISGYPWLTKRLARVLHGADAPLPARKGLAYVLALFVPYAGRAGGGAGVIVVVAIIGVLAAVALPAYQDYTQRAAVAAAWQELDGVRSGVAAFYEKNQQPPETLDQAGVASSWHGQPLQLNTENMVITVSTSAGALEMTPKLNKQRQVEWHCAAGEGMRPAAPPTFCR